LHCVLDFLSTLLKKYLQVTDDNLAEYILNQQAAIETFCEGDSVEALALKENLADLDAGILTLIENHHCSEAEIADTLDAALKNSYWRSRLAVIGGDTETLQELFIKSRATWVWKSTDSLQRRGFYAAGIGLSAGKVIVENTTSLRSMLIGAAAAIEAKKSDDLARHCGDVARLLFPIYPFQPDSLVSSWNEADWRPFLKIWLAGEALAKISDPKGISFVQEAIVFRLVWAVEATRVILNHVDMFEEEQIGMDMVVENVAVCLTYGVPSVSSARLLECGMESRVFAQRLIEELDLSFSERNDVVSWFNSTNGNIDVAMTAEETAVWNAFCNRLNRERSERMEYQSRSFSFDKRFDIDERGPAIRVSSNDQGNEDLYSSDFQYLGTYQLGLHLDSTVVGQIDGNVLAMSYFAVKK